MIRTYLLGKVYALFSPPIFRPTHPPYPSSYSNALLVTLNNRLFLTSTTRGSSGSGSQRGTLPSINFRSGTGTLQGSSTSRGTNSTFSAGLRSKHAHTNTTGGGEEYKLEPFGRSLASPGSPGSPNEDEYNPYNPYDDVRKVHVGSFLTFV